MNRFLLLPTFLLLNNIALANWETKFAEHKARIDHKGFAILEAQFRAFKAGTLPKIADVVIKAIPIRESGEEVIDIRSVLTPRLQMMPNPSNPFEAAEFNAGFSASSKVRTGLYNNLLLLLANLDELAIHFGYARGQIEIRVFEGLRSLETQKNLFDNKANEIRLLRPEWSELEVKAETSKWVSPVENNVPVHSTGGAVDIRLFDNKRNSFVDMGNFGVIWGSNPNAPTFSEELSEEQISNRIFLCLAALASGLVNYPYEFWHFSSSDRYAVYWQKPSILEAKYGGL